MVKRHTLLAALSAIFALMILTSSAAAWTGTFHIEREWVKIWINQNGTIDLFYNITISLDSGDNITYVLVGQPNSYLTIGNATDQYSNTLYPTNASQGTDYKVKVPLHTPLKAGQSIWFTLITNVDHVIYNDTKYNPGNLGMLFTPCWWSVTVKDLRVLTVLPPGVNETTVKTFRDWNNVFNETGCLAVYWEKHDLTPDEQKDYSVGVSFPQEYMPNYFTTEPPPEKKPSDGFLPYVAPFLFFGTFIFIIVIGAIAISKKHYLIPKISMETLGIKHGLTAVEASYLLDMKPTQIVTETLYSLLKKRAVWVESTKPAIKLQIMPQFQDKTGTHETPLRYYEIDFLNTIKEDGTLDEEKLAETVMTLRDTVEEKMQGYCRRDTIDYYTKIVAKAWEQVEQAGTSELASNAYDEQLLWLLLDPNFQSHTQTVFQDRAFEPSPYWLWYWYGYQHYNPHPTYKPNVEAPAQSAKPPTIPGADFANNIATAVEGTANNIVINIEKFANAIIPMPTAKASNEPAHHGATCVCACAACACACVSCACACASGGVG